MCAFNITVLDQRSTPVASTATTILVGGIAGGILVFVAIALGIVLFLLRKSKQRVFTLETFFTETDEAILAKAKVIKAVMLTRNKNGISPVIRDLPKARPQHIDVDTPDVYSCELDRAHVTMDKEIGAGEFGQVFSGVVNRKGAKIPCAVKICKPGIELTCKEAFIKEIRITAKLDYPNVISCIGYIVSTEPTLLCLEFLDIGSLQFYLTFEMVSNALENREMCSFAIDICAGLHYINGSGILHRDLACRNVLLTKERRCKISDFGLAIIIPNTEHEVILSIETNGRIPIRWSAPEAIAAAKWSVTSDTWSFGIVLWEIWSYAKLPYLGWANERLILEVTENQYRLPPPTSCPMIIYAMMMGMKG